MTDLMDTDESDLIRPNSLFLRGVDDLSQKDIKNYLKRYVGDHFKIEWINDSSLNVVFEEKEEASNALKSLTKDSETELDVLTERDAFQFDKAKPDVEFTIRMSKISDKKVKRAAQYSRYYLMNPEEEKKFKMAKYVSRSFRDREPLGRKSRILSDDEDEIDLFPQRANEEAVIRDSQWTTSEMNSTPLSERVSISESNPLSERLGDLDDDDLFKR